MIFLIAELQTKTTKSKHETEAQNNICKVIQVKLIVVLWGRGGDRNVFKSKHFTSNIT